MFIIILIILFLIIYFLNYTIEDFQNQYRECQIHIDNSKDKNNVLTKLNSIISQYNHVLLLENKIKEYKNKIIDVDYTLEKIEDIKTQNDIRKKEIINLNQQIKSESQTINSYNLQLSSYHKQKQTLLQNLPKTKNTNFIDGLYYIIYNDDRIIYHNVLHDFNNIYYPDTFTSIHIKGLFKSNKPDGRWFFNIKNKNSIKINDDDNTYPLIYNKYYKIHIILYQKDNITFQHHSELESSTLLDGLFFSPLKNPLFYHSLNWRVADGYPFDNVNYFKTHKVIRNGKTNHIHNINFAVNNIQHQGNINRETYAVDVYGFFKPNITGKWTFSLSSDDMSYMWINHKNEIDSNNIFINNGGLHGMVTRTNNIYLVKNKLYPIYIIFGENTGGDNLVLTIRNPQNQIIRKQSDLFITFNIDKDYDKNINIISKHENTKHNTLKEIYNINHFITKINENINNIQSSLNEKNNQKNQLQSNIKIDDHLYNNIIQNIENNTKTQEKIDEIQSELDSIDPKYKKEIQSNLNHFNNLKSDVKNKSILSIKDWNEYAYDNDYQELKSFKSTNNTNEEVSGNWKCFKENDNLDKLKLKYNNNDLYQDKNGVINMTFSKNGKNPIYYIY
jgi:hypothetical protein